MRDALQRVGQAVREIIHGIDAPGIARAVVLGVADAVERGVAHDQVGRGHVDLGPQHAHAVRKLPGAHAAEEIQIFLHAAVAVRALAAGLGERAAIFADLLGGEVVHIGLAHFDELFGVFVELFKIVGGVEFAVLPVPAQPAHVLADGLHVFGLFLGGIGVVKAQIAEAAELLGHAEIETDGLGVPEVQIAVGLRREARVHLAAETAGGIVFLNPGADEVHAGLGRFVGRGVIAGLHRVGLAGGGHSALHAEVINGNL